MPEREPDWDTIAELEAESRRDWQEVLDEPAHVNDGMFHCPSCGAMPGEPHREPCPF